MNVTNITSRVDRNTPEYAFDLGYKCAEAGEACRSPYAGTLRCHFHDGWNHYQAEMAGAVTPHSCKTRAAWPDNDSPSF